MTAVPATIDALVAVVSGDAGFTSVRVFDGPWVDRPSEPDVVVFGWSLRGRPTVDYSETPELGSSAASFSVDGAVSSWTGDDNMAGVRSRADALLENLRVLLRADPTLGAVVTSASLSTGTLNQMRSPEGCEAFWSFSVQVISYSHP